MGKEIGVVNNCIDVVKVPGHEKLNHRLGHHVSTVLHSTQRGCEARALKKLPPTEQMQSFTEDAPDFVVAVPTGHVINETLSQ